MFTARGAVLSGERRGPGNQLLPPPAAPSEAIADHLLSILILRAGSWELGQPGRQRERNPDLPNSSSHSHHGCSHAVIRHVTPAPSSMEAARPRSPSTVANSTPAITSCSDRPHAMSPHPPPAAAPSPAATHSALQGTEQAGISFPAGSRREQPLRHPGAHDRRSEGCGCRNREESDLLHLWVSVLRRAEIPGSDLGRSPDGRGVTSGAGGHRGSGGLVRSGSRPG